VQLGVVFDPVHDELFTAVAGQGSCRNGAMIQRNGRAAQLSEAIFALDWGRSRQQRQQMMAVFQNLVHEVRTIRSIGSAALALCWIADGRLDAYINYNMKAWDIAAAGLILCEAGGQVSAANGATWNMRDQFTWRVSSSLDINRELLRRLASKDYDARPQF
jgi:myo-inositol-1(or 4)-monophosphatase